MKKIRKFYEEHKEAYYVVCAAVGVISIMSMRHTSVVNGLRVDSAHLLQDDENTFVVLRHRNGTDRLLKKVVTDK